MRFGTFFFFQAAPGLTHEEVVHRELEQMEWTEELGFDQIWLTEHHFIDYGLAVDPATLATAAASRTRRVRIGLAAAILPFHHPLRLAGPLDQLLKRRDSYLAALRRHGRSEEEIAGLMKNWGVSRQIYVAESDAQALAEAKDAEMWYQDSLRRFQVPERIEDAHPSLQPGFRALAERFAKVTWEGLVAETLAFGSPDTVARHIETMRDMGVGHVMCWMNFGGLPQDKIRRSMELFAKEVMPRFRDA